MDAILGGVGFGRGIASLADPRSSSNLFVFYLLVFSAREIKALKQKAYMHDLNMQLEENKSHANYPAQNNGNRAHGRQEASHGHQSDGVRVLVCSFN
jgi:hypothetical protein